MTTNVMTPIQSSEENRTPLQWVKNQLILWIQHMLQIETHPTFWSASAPNLAVISYKNLMSLDGIIEKTPDTTVG
jgi:hypothetical protein